MSNINKSIDYISRDYDGFKQLMLAELQKKIPEYTDVSETDAGVVILESLANGLDILSLYLDIISNDLLLPTTQDRSIAVIISKCLGYTPYNQTAAKYKQVFVLSGTRDESTLIPKGTVIKTKKSPDLATIYFETMEDFIIPSGMLGDEKDAEGNYMYSVLIQQGSSVYQDVVGISKGSPLQSFKLNYTSVLTDTISLYIKSSNKKELWTMVDNFINSDENSKVYTISIDEFDVCTISFGNGINGKIPDVDSLIIVDYRIGGGDIGNVSKNIITDLDTNIPYVKNTFNLDVLERGHDKESLDSIKQNAPANYRCRDSIVTLSDYSDLLKINFYEFLDVITIRDSNDKKLVHIYYILKNNYNIESIYEKVKKFLDARIMIGTQYDINSYVEQLVDIDARMYVNADYNGNILVENIKEYLKGVTFFYDNLRFKSTILKSDLESDIKNTFEGILSFRINTPIDDIISPTNPQNILKLGNINIYYEYL